MRSVRFLCIGGVFPSRLSRGFLGQLFGGRSFPTQLLDPCSREGGKEWVCTSQRVVVASWLAKRGRSCGELIKGGGEVGNYCFGVCIWFSLGGMRWQEPKRWWCSCKPGWLFLRMALLWFMSFWRFDSNGFYYKEPLPKKNHYYR